METKFKVGDKVKIPKTKNVLYKLIPLEDCSAILEAKELNQDFLYIVEILNNNDVILGVRKDYRQSNFSLKDLELYKEKQMNKKQVFLSLETAKLFYNGVDKAAKQFALDNYTEEELKSKSLPMSWEEFINNNLVKGFYIHSYDDMEDIPKVKSLKSPSLKKNIYFTDTFPTQSLAKGALALAQLLQLRDKWNEGIDLKLSDVNTDKWAVYYSLEKKDFYVAKVYVTNKIFTFKNESTAELFLKTFEDLLTEAKEYI